MAAAQDSRRKSDEGLWETVKVIIQALLIAFFVRTFLYQPFNIPSGSMYPTLNVGDYIFVSKLSYGYGKYSFNFTAFWFRCCPIDFPGRVVFADTPKRGDVAVFKKPSDTDIDYIKRVIGLPGDRIQMKDGVLFINGEAVKKERTEDYIETPYRDYMVDQQTPQVQTLYRFDATDEVSLDPAPKPVPQYVETLPNGVKYRVLDAVANSSEDNTQEFLVPPDHYFMMGDNRDNSADSRFPDVGYVPIENFVGRADVIFFSISHDASWWEVWRWPFAIRWGRFFNLL
ncbi:MAG: signal peptidase I [Rhizobiales bacterium]|nr:signal peptidase I [Hyphomicrobiales bacterium]